MSSLHQQFFGPTGRCAQLGLPVPDAGKLRAVTERFRRRGLERQKIVEGLRLDGYFHDRKTGATVELDDPATLAGKRFDSRGVVARLDGFADRPAWIDPAADETPDEALWRVAAEVQRRMDSARWVRGQRRDSISPMASEALTYFYEVVYQIEHRDLVMWDGEILQVDRRPDPAAREIVWYERDRVGTAKAGTQYSPGTIPLVGTPIMSPNALRVLPALAGWETNFMEDRYEALSRRNGKPTIDLEREKIETANRVLAEFWNAVWFYGDAQSGLGGWLNDDRARILPLAGGPWSGKTGLQIANDLNQMIWSIRNNSFGRLRDFGNVTIYLPPSQYERASNEIISAAGDKSAMAYVMDNLRQQGRPIAGIKIVDELQATNSFAYDGGPPNLDADTAVVMYAEGNMDRDPVAVMPQEIEVVPAGPILTGVGEVTYQHSRGSGMRLPDAERLLYVKGL